MADSTMNTDNNNSMTPQQLLQLWRNRARVAQKAHFESSAQCTRMHFLLGMAVVVLTTAVGSDVLDELSVGPVAASLLSLCAAIFAAGQTFMQFPQRAERHKAVAIELSDLKKEIEHLQAFPLPSDSELRDRTAAIRIRWDQITKEAPTALSRVWARVKGGATTANEPET